jgi:hypothetical protein
MRVLIFLMAVVLLVLHQDFWLWGNDSLFLGFMPAGLAYHSAYSIACAILGAIAIRFAWAEEDENA